MNETIEQTLAERGKRYGDFRSHACITQAIKKVINDNGGSQLEPMHREALDMIAHKIGRILNGDPNYADSWVDISGYATLVVQRLPKDV